MITNQMIPPQRNCA
ncbi:hypothetical protein D910_00230 [Dendroctonus ponderosae]|uniref:Uncharacterized protein n=1 Tax=Dendroctonus ponderosae TaxID=77166 RepID=U4UNU5_DENPD|nr:hypothetical protein D910_00230 [Dendroctonus ponderosae]